MSAMENESLPGRILRHYYHIIKILLHAGYTKIRYQHLQIDLQMYIVC